MIERIAILGAGAWGTALARIVHRPGRRVTLQAHDPAVAAAIVRDRENARYLPNVPLAPEMSIVADPAEAVSTAQAVLLAVPAQFMRETLRRCAYAWPSGVPALICAKGIEQGSCALLSEVIAEMLPDAPLGILTGPSFASEVARELPTAVTLACLEERWRERLPAELGTRTFRIYSTDDVAGAQIGGAVKNVIAIACGIVQGRHLGANARAALITRGLAEMARFAAARGAQPQTLSGLSGLGDLVLTCNAMQSRNFSLGVALGRGRPLGDVLGERITVAEGVHTAAAVVAMARNEGVEMPICAAVDAVLNQGASLNATIEGLLARPLKAEVFAAEPPAAHPA